MKWFKNNSVLVVLSGSVLLIAIGVIAIMHPFSTYIRLVRYLAPALFIHSILLFVSSYQYPEGSGLRGWTKFKSILDLLFVLILSFNPLLTFIAFPILAGPVLICSGIIKITGGLFMRKMGQYAITTILAGVLFMAFGFVIAFSSYSAGANAGIFTGIFCLLLGALYLASLLKTGSSEPVTLY